MHHFNRHKGTYIALTIILLWCFCLVTAFLIEVDFSNPLIYILFLFQIHLYTGLFITAHDAMHGVVSANKPLNKAIGTVSAALFAYNSYPRLFPKHHLHHRHVATDEDPDFYHGSFIPWYFKFLMQYVTIWQIILMAITYNVLLLFFPQVNIILFWIVPSILATLQLFYFGTYLPHKGEHRADNKHKARSLQKNHWLAFISCYFFGYHYEHHHAPYVPWWQLYKEKEKQLQY